MKNKDAEHCELDGLSVTVDNVVYMPSLDAPAEKPNPFVYFITIHNDSAEVVKITGRKWVVRENDGELIVVEGDGVVGQMPEIEPGERFSYNSYHFIAADAVAGGMFFGFSTSGKKVRVRIPNFNLELPDWV
ncbi:MAG: ApaG domain-containing protein [Akkermansiaceae bacterium]